MTILGFIFSKRDKSEVPFVRTIYTMGSNVELYCSFYALLILFSDYLLKVLVLGESGVGKSNIVLRYCDESFSDMYISTIGVDFKFKQLKIDDKNIKLQIWYAHPSCDFPKLFLKLIREQGYSWTREISVMIMRPFLTSKYYHSKLLQKSAWSSPRV